jgi:hypothetical protein
MQVELRSVAAVLRVPEDEGIPLPEAASLVGRRIRNLTPVSIARSAVHRRAAYEYVVDVSTRLDGRRTVRRSQHPEGVKSLQKIRILARRRRRETIVVATSSVEHKRAISSSIPVVSSLSRTEIALRRVAVVLQDVKLKLTYSRSRGFIGTHEEVVGRPVPTISILHIK